VKLAVIGAGSTYTPELVSGLSRERARIGVDDLVLHDVDRERLDVVGGLAQRMLSRQGYEGRLELTQDLDRAVDGADFVLVQIRVGGQEARLGDETVPLACGCIGQETTGAGGFAKALRTVPVVLGIAERARALAASGAWIVDFTNPVGIVTRALLDELGALPSYYLRYFYAHDQVLAEQREEQPRAARVAEIESELLELYRDPALTEKPALLEQRGGAFYSEAAVGLVSSLLDPAGEDVHVVDVRNGGTLAGLAGDDVVEVPAKVSSRGIEALTQAPLAPELLGLVQHVAAYERLAARAAVSGDVDVARKALLTHPLIGQYEITNELLERLLERGADHLPQFRREARV
jgi:alpha-galactosidase/6-phospho-beta-glucosidase family protein